MRVIATAGHVDHGKSTLVQALTGIDPDRFEEEKRRGLTIDLGFAWLTLASGLEVGIVDVPGHERFIRNMLAGVGSVDAVLFVVAADEGWMPQSTEHLEICDLLGIAHGVVALTKTDTASELADLAEDDVREHLRGTSLESAPIVRVSAKTGAGLEELKAALDEALAVEPRGDDRDRPRVWIDRSFTIKGTGTVVTGTLTGGPIATGDEVSIVPEGRRARVRSMQTHGVDVEGATGPRRLAVNLVGLDRRLVHRGDALVAGDWICTKRFAARIRPLRDGFKERGAYELFVGSAQTRCRVRLLSEDLFAEIFVDRALPILPGDRFVIRDVGRWQTIAGGVVIDQSPPKLRRGDTAALRAREDAADLATVIVEQRGFVRRFELTQLVGRTISGDGYEVDAKHAEMLRQKAFDSLRTFHTRQPLAPGMPIASLRTELGIPADLLDDLIASWSIVRDKTTVRLPEHGVALSAEQRKLADEALATLKAGGVSPPELQLDRALVQALERSGEIVLATPSIAVHADVWRDIVERVRGLGTFTVAEFRDAVGTSRKYAVPFLEKLDATGVTRRKGDVREVR